MLRHVGLESQFLALISHHLLVSMQVSLPLLTLDFHLPDSWSQCRVAHQFSLTACHVPPALRCEPVITSFFTSFSLVLRFKACILHLIDGSSPSYITCATDILVWFPCGTVHQVWFLITKLDTKFPAVLGLDWLTLHNLLIDWADSSLSL